MTRLKTSCISKVDNRGYAVNAKQSRIDLGIISDSNSFRKLSNDTPDLFKVAVQLNSDGNSLGLVKEQIFVGSGETWRNPNLADPLSHLPSFIKSSTTWIDKSIFKEVLLTTIKDQLMIPYLFPDCNRQPQLTQLSSLQSDNLGNIDVEVDTFLEKSVSNFDLILIRHSLEHSKNALKLLWNLKSLLAPNGKMVIEVPLFEITNDMCFLEQFWEEHVHYFTLNSLGSLVRLVGLNTLSTEVYSTENEPVIMMVLNQSATDILPIIPQQFDLNTKSFTFSDIQDECARMQSFLTGMALENKLIFFGANHKTFNLIDLFVTSPQKVEIFDGDERKIGRYGSKYNILIRPLSDLSSYKHDTIFTTLNTNKIKFLQSNSALPYSLTKRLMNIYQFVSTDFK